MSFDSFERQLRQAFEALTDRLRDQIVREIAGVTDELLKQARVDRELAATEAADDARAGAERAADARVAEAEQAAAARLAETASTADRTIEARVRQAVDQAVAAARVLMRNADLAAADRQLEAIRAIDRARSLSEILETLVTSAGREAARVAILLVRGTTMTGWRFVGFGAAFDAAHDTNLALDASGVIGDAVRTGAAVSADTAGTLATPPFDLSDGRERVAVPIAMSGQVVAVLYADQGPQDDPAREPPIAWPATLDVMARHAARCLEALTAFKAARVLTEHPDVAARAGPGAGESSAGVDSSTDEEESARRYARLLVSEIKMYHEPAVAAGRRERDLGTRLGAEIARARGLYEQRVPAHVRQQADHFHAELVHTLANGDASLLGQAT
jgi:hypothetical protein